MSAKRKAAIQRIDPPKPEEIAEQHMQNLAAQLHGRIRQWRKEISAIQDFEAERIKSWLTSRNKAFHQEVMPIIGSIKDGKLDLDSALEEMSTIRARLNDENEGIFQSYINTLELMCENINIELIATEGTADNIDLRDQLNQFNQVAQLDIDKWNDPQDE